MMSRIRKWLYGDGEIRQQTQIAEARERVIESAARQSELLRMAVDANARTADALEQLVREMQRGERR